MSTWARFGHLVIAALLLCAPGALFVSAETTADDVLTALAAAGFVSLTLLVSRQWIRDRQTRNSGRGPSDA